MGFNIINNNTPNLITFFILKILSNKVKIEDAL